MNQKLDNLLNLALESTQKEREESLNLDIGYEEKEREWELIVKYSGKLSGINGLARQVIPLLTQYAIVTIEENKIEELSRLAEVEYIEKPKRLFFETVNGKRVSCVGEVQNEVISLYGKGVLVAIIDSGIDYFLNTFRNADGTTRIRAIWDQSLIPQGEEQSPKGYEKGVEYQQEEINRALNGEGNLLRTRDFTGHGTAVAGIVSGSDGVVGVAPQSELLIVKMGNAKQNGFPRTTELMLGIDYAIRKSIEYQMPVAINVSFGNTYGSHTGTSLLEQYIDGVSGIGKSTICIGTGNEASSAGHTSGILGEREEEVFLAVQEQQTTFNLQIWKDYADEFVVSIVSPSGEKIGPIRQRDGVQRYTIRETELLVYYGMPSPYSVSQEIYIEFLSSKDYINTGIWNIILVPQRVRNGKYEMWLPSEGTLNLGTAFLNPKSDLTLTIPATAKKAISVGAYDGNRGSYAQFSGRGYVNMQEGSKPDIVAPGVNVVTSAVGGGTVLVSGTSFATPFATGASALLMEWGIVDGNDPFLYGEKIKAYLRRGAKLLPGFTSYPNPWIGYGEDVIIRLHSRKSVKSSVSVHFPNTETKHFFHNFEENLPGLDAK